MLKHGQLKTSYFFELLFLYIWEFDIKFIISQDLSIVFRYPSQLHLYPCTSLLCTEKDFILIGSIIFDLRCMDSLINPIPSSYKVDT